MSASNYNWVCFRRRTSIRQAKTSPRVPICTLCGDELYCLGYKVEIPKKSDLDSWKRLQESCWNIRTAQRQKVAVKKVQRKHALEREISRLETLEENLGRRQLIKSLKKKLNEVF